MKLLLDLLVDYQLLSEATKTLHRRTKKSHGFPGTLESCAALEHHLCVAGYTIAEYARLTGYGAMQLRRAAIRLKLKYRPSDRTDTWVLKRLARTLNNLLLLDCERLATRILELPDTSSRCRALNVTQSQFFLLLRAYGWKGVRRLTQLSHLVEKYQDTSLYDREFVASVFLKHEGDIAKSALALYLDLDEMQYLVMFYRLNSIKEEHSDILNAS